MTDEDGYDVLDVKRHQTYAEWKEAKSIYEKLVKELEDGEQKQQAIARLIRLYAATGETEKGLALIKKLPDISGSSDMLYLNALDGKRRMKACDKALSKMLFVCANLMCDAIRIDKRKITTAEAIKRIKMGISILEMDPADTPVLPNDREVYRGKVGLYFHMMNSAGEKKKQGGIFGSNKTGLHGFGLRRAMTMIEENGGWCKFNSEDGAFTSEFLVPAIR